MVAERNTGKHAQPGTPDSHQETLTADAFTPGDADGVSSLVEMHRRTAVRLLSEGRATHAFAELVRASRAVPMTPRLAALLVTFSLKAAAEPAAITLLQTGLDDTDSGAKVAVRRQLVRLFRKLKELERAREHLVLILAERPSDRRARRVLNALLEAEQRWEELDASLEKEARDALKRASLRRASRATLLRARVYERLGNHPRAALRYAQAAQYLEQAKDLHGALDLRLLWLRSLREAEAPPRALAEAVDTFLVLGATCGQKAQAQKRAQALGLLPGGAGSKQGRSETQRELVVAAEAAEAQGRKTEAAALLNAAVNEGPDPATLRKLEAHYVARRAWRDLAQFYRDRAAQARDKAEQVEHLTRLAEVLEDELHDPEGAANAYAEIVVLTGDEGALREQVRLLSEKEDQSGVRRAFDRAVDGASSGPVRARALTARGEAALRKRDYAKARGDFEAALKFDPDNLLAHAGCAEAAARAADPAPARAFAQALKSAPRRFVGRTELCRRLAVLAEGALKDAALARWAWLEVLGETPEDEQALDHVADVARRTGDDALLEDALGRILKQEPRGPRARKTRLELIACFERNQRRDDALTALREAVRFEPGHKEAWLFLSDRLAARGIHGEAAWALEQAATATENEAERAQTWARLGRFTREVLKDAQKAEVFDRRAKKLQEELLANPALEPTPARPTRKHRAEPEKGTDPDARPPQVSPTARTEFELPAVDEELAAALSGKELDDASGAALKPLQVPWDDVEEAQPADVLEITTGDFEVPSDPPAPVEEWDAPPGQMDSGPTTQELPVPLGEGAVAATPSMPTPMVSKLREARAQHLERVRKDPLDAEGYRELADYFDHVGDADRSALMAEIASALEGDPHAAPRAPRLILSATDRAGLRHPTLRGEEGELLSLAGVALCRLFPARGKDAGSREEFRMDAGRGAQQTAEALLSGVRILGLRAPDVFLSEDNGPPFSLAYTAHGARVLVGRLAVKKELPEGELRFFAGRALFTQNPDLLALRTLKKDQLARGLGVLASVVRGKQLSAEARAMKDGLAPKAIPRLQELLRTVGRDLPLAQLVEAARHSANRAGLVLAGGVAPALAALKAKKALRSEVVELVRFAASERYLQLRTRRLG